MAVNSIGNEGARSSPFHVGISRYQPLVRILAGQIGPEPVSTIQLCNRAWTIQTGAPKSWTPPRYYEVTCNKILWLLEVVGSTK